MANRYGYQYTLQFKPKMASIEGFVSIGTGGLVNYPDAYPIFPVATGATGTAGQTGAPRFLMPGQATAGVPTGWSGGFSGCIGLIGAGVKGIQRVATGFYAIGLEDDWCALDSFNATVFTGATGSTGIADLVTQHTVGQGNTVMTGGYTLPVFPGPNPKNMIYVQFHANGPAVDIPPGGGIFLDIRLRDSLSGVH